MGHAWRLGSAPRAKKRLSRLQAWHRTPNACPQVRETGGKAGPSIVLTISAAPLRLGAHILTSNLGWSRASQRSESQRRAVDVARVWPALLRGSSMEVLQRLGAQAPAERGHEGSRACIGRSRVQGSPPTRAAGTPSRGERRGSGMAYLQSLTGRRSLAGGVCMASEAMHVPQLI